MPHSLSFCSNLSLLLSCSLPAPSYNTLCKYSTLPWPSVPEAGLWQHRREGGLVQALERVPFQGHTGAALQLGNQRGLSGLDDRCSRREGHRSDNESENLFSSFGVPTSPSGYSDEREDGVLSTSTHTERFTTQARQLFALPTPSPSVFFVTGFFLLSQRL